MCHHVVVNCTVIISISQQILSDLLYMVINGDTLGELKVLIKMMFLRALSVRCVHSTELSLFIIGCDIGCFECAIQPMWYPGRYLYISKV